MEVRGLPDGFAGDRIPRAWTLIQAKRNAMPPAAIREEMALGGTLRPIIAELAEAGGAYLIAPLGHATAMQVREREAAMRAVAEGPLGRTDIVLHDRGPIEISRWVADHLGMAIWARDRLALPLAGWRPHGRWSTTPQGRMTSVSPSAG